MRRFAAIAYNEVLLNSKRVAPHVLMILFAANAVLWWAKGPAVTLVWATNSDYYIHRNLVAFCFLTGMPIFNALIMCDSVIKDFQIGIDGLLFSKPISRAQYLFAKFTGSFITLVCCQFSFVLTSIVLQFFRTPQMVVQPFQAWPYFKHFFLIVVVSHALLAAIYFTVGTLTRSAKLVYGLAVGFYPIYISYQVFVLNGLPRHWTILLDPILLRSGLPGGGFLNTAEFLNQLIIVYTPWMLLNRGLTIVWAASCLAILYARFSTQERGSAKTQFSTLNLAGESEYVFVPEHAELVSDTPQAIIPPIVLPTVTARNDGFHIDFQRLMDATAMETNLLRAERSLIVLLPLAVILCTLEIAFFPVRAEISYSAAYASSTTTTMLIFVIGFAVFYIGEAMHRDREIRIEPFLWTTPISNSVLILSKFLATLLLLSALIVSVGVAAVAIQLIRHHTPIALIAYLKVYGLILVPSAFLLTAIAVLGNVVLRNKYAFYVVSIGTAAGLFYLYSNGYNYWIYNPVLYRLWSYADLTQGAALRTIVWHRACWLAAAIGALALAHCCFERKSGRSHFHS
jgi:ABC-2 type transport system permease protein